MEHHHQHLPAGEEGPREGRRSEPSPLRDDLSTTAGSSSSTEPIDAKSGFFSQYPECLRRLCGSGGFLVIHCLQQLVAGGANTYLAASTSHLHRHLRLSHRHLAVILLLRDLGPVLTGVVLSQLGGRGHRPRWVAAGQLLAALATFATVATFFTHSPPPAEWWDSNSRTHYCDVERLVALATSSPVTTIRLPGNTTSLASSLHTPTSRAPSCLHAHSLVVMVWILASILNGVGNCVIFSVGIPYLDDAIDKHDSSLYLAVIISTGVFGPLLGLSLSAVTLNIYVYPGQDPGVGVEEPSWIGAWWVGQLGLSVVMLAMGCVLLLFPRRLGKTASDKLHSFRKTIRNTDEDVRIAEMVSTSVVPCDPPYFSDQSFNNNNNAPEVADDDYSVEEREAEEGYAMDERDSGYSVEELENGHAVEERFGRCVVEADDVQKTLDKAAPKETETNSQEIKNGLKEVWSTMERLLRNKVIVYTACSDFFFVLAISAVVVWLPKYIQQQFRVTEVNSSFYTGICGTSSAIVGVGVGGVWVRRCRPQARTVALVMAACLALQASTLLPLTFISCGFDNDLPGVLSPDRRSVELHRGCSEGCRCVAAQMSPVCVQDGPISLSYYSPCHAGCPLPSRTNSQRDFVNCTCGSVAAKVTLGYCRDNCSTFILYNVITCITKSLLSVVAIGSLLITLRCVEVQDKPAALGIKSTVMSLAAMVSPLVLGTLMDSACLVWEEACGTQTTCSLYNTTDFGHKFHGLTCILFILSTFFTLLISRHVSHLQLLEETPHNLPSVSFFDTETRTSPSIRRSFRKMSRLVTGRKSSGKWKVPRMTSFQPGSGEREVTSQEKSVRNEERVRDGEIQPVESVVTPTLLPSLVMKTTGV